MTAFCYFFGGLVGCCCEGVCSEGAEAKGYEIAQKIAGEGCVGDEQPSLVVVKHCKDDLGLKVL